MRVFLRREMCKAFGSEDECRVNVCICSTGCDILVRVANLVPIKSERSHG